MGNKIILYTLHKKVWGDSSIQIFSPQMQETGVTQLPKRKESEHKPLFGRPVLVSQMET